VTMPRLLGNWLGGVIFDDNPETDYEKRMSGPAVPREDAVLIDPLTLHSFTVHLGEWCELLSIDGDVVYYRVDKGLYRARIQDDGFVERRLLVTDRIVRGINWAFRGSE